MSEEIQNENPYDIELKVETEFGELCGIYNYRKALDEFQFYFQTKTSETNIVNGKEVTTLDIARWSSALRHAESVLKELIPQILDDALKQVWYETTVRTLNELNDATFFQRFQTANVEDYQLNPLQVLNISQTKIIKACEEIEEKARKKSRQRMKMDKQGGSLGILGGFNFGALENYYDYYLSQAKSILFFYEKKREWLEKENRSLNFHNSEKWNKYFLETLFDITATDFKKLSDSVENLYKELTQTKNKSKQLKIKKSIEELEIAQRIIDLYPLPKIEYIKGETPRISYGANDDIELWKKTFRKILVEGYDSKISHSNKLTPNVITLELLAVKYEIAPRTVKNNLEELREYKISLLKESG